MVKLVISAHILCMHENSVPETLKQCQRLRETEGWSGVCDGSLCMFSCTRPVLCVHACCWTCVFARPNLGFRPRLCLFTHRHKISTRHQLVKYASCWWICFTRKPKKTVVNYWKSKFCNQIYTLVSWLFRNMENVACKNTSPGVWSLYSAWDWWENTSSSPWLGFNIKNLGWLRRR